MDELAFATRSVAAALQVPRDELRVGKFECLAPLERGDGATGQVWIARDLETHDLVALKLARPELMPHVELVFRQERRKGDQLRDKRILSAIDGGTHEGRPYLVMPLMCGTLADYSNDYRDPARALELMLQVVDAVRVAHRHAILHCDLKPENIFLDDQRRVRIGDLGLARKVVASGATQGEAWGGTPGYMSPEQVKGGPLSVATDVFSLGVILYELLTGRLPFGSGSEFVHRVLHDDPAPLFPVRPWARKFEWELAAICHRALGRLPKERYRSANELLNDLKCARKGRPIRSERKQPGRRAIKWVRRNSLPAIAALETLIFLLCLPFILDATAEQVRGNIRKQNEFSAVAQAGAVLGQLTDLGLRVSAMARDPDVLELVTHPGITVPAPALQAHAVGFDSVSVFTAEGIHRARLPIGSAEGLENCLFKDYFQCAKQIADAGSASGELGVCVARAHLSALDGKVKLALAAPLRDENGTFLGVVEASTKARDRFGAVQMKCGSAECWTALLGPRDREAASAPFPSSLSILAQAGLKEGGAVSLPDPAAKRICEKLSCAPSLRAQLAPRRDEPPLVLDPYEDPLTGAKAVAVVAPVGGTGLSVLIATPDTAADAQATRLLGSYRFAGLPLLLGLAVISGVLLAPRRPWRPSPAAPRQR